MKTALEWQSETGPGNTASVAWIQSIQMDAWLQGRSDAAEIVNDMRGESESDLRCVRDRIKYSNYQQNLL